jgi:hypothetical protein
MPQDDPMAGIARLLPGLKADRRTPAADLGVLAGKIETGGADILAARPQDAFSVLAMAGIGPAADLRGLAPSRVAGPFIDLDGRRLFVDVFEAGKLTPVIPKGETTPLMLVPGGSARRMRDQIAINITAGTVWIAAGLFSSKAPAKGWAGLPVRGGTARFAAATTTGTAIAAPPRGEIVLELGYEPDPANTCPDAAITAPAKLTITIDGGKATVALDGGEARFGGTTHVVEPAEKVVWHAAENGLWFPADIAPTAIDAAGIDWRVAGFDAGFRIARGGWLIPVVVNAAPETLPQASTSGHWCLALKGDPQVGWAGLNGRVRITDPTLLIGQGVFMLIDRSAAADPGAATRFDLWALGADIAGRQGITATLATAGAVVIGCAGAGRHFAMAEARLAERLACPRDHAGRPVATRPVAAMVMISEEAGQLRADLMATGFAGDAPGSLRLVVENAVLATGLPAIYRVSGTVDADGVIRAGTLDLVFGLLNWLPTLPDPYVSSCAGGLPLPQAGAAAPEGVLRAAVSWSGDGPPALAFAGDLPPPLLGCDLPSKPDQRPARLPDRELTGQTAQGTGLHGEAQQAIRDRARRAAEKFKGNEVWPKAQAGFNDRVGTLGRRPGVALLDVSTRRHQIGVAFETRRDQPLTHAVPLPGGTAQIEGLRFKTGLRVFALPQIQWEPVRTLDADQDLATLGWFPTPLASAGDGGPAMIRGAAKLRPAIPDLALEEMVAGFGSGDPLEVLTTLPFGMMAKIEMKGAADADAAADTATMLRPRFHQGGPLEGGHQLSLRAGTPTAAPPRQSASFRGLATQTPNGVDLASGAPLNISVLGATAGADGAVEAMFNNEFTLFRPRVPVTRLDLSGYGSSTFSDWGNPFAAFAEAAKVQFQVMVGRTALEVVKFVSVIYPWGIRATRTVTIERRGGGGVLRRDSGWQAASAGLFDFRYVPKDETELRTPDYEIHPGLIRGIYDVARIRPSDRPAIDLPAGGKVLPMYFDAVAEIGTDAAHTRTPVRGMLGWLHLLPVGDPITPGELDQLLRVYGPAGGPVEVSLPLDASGFRMRLKRIEAAAAWNGPNPAIVGALGGAPQFGAGNGAWSVAAFPGPAHPDQPGEAVAAPDGVAVLRAGEAGTPLGDRIHVPAAAPILTFQDPQDLFAGAGPRTDYAFVQTTPTHAFAFRRPRIQIGSSDITAGLPALFADVFARTTGAGVFPHPDAAIPLGGAGSHRLRVNPANGRFRLMPPVAMAPGPVQIVLSDDVDAGSRIDYAASSITLAIEEDSWSLTMPRVKVWTDILGLTDVTGMQADIIGGSTLRPKLTAINSLMHPVLEDIMTFLPGFSSRPEIAPIDLAATNLKYKVKLKTVAEKEVKLGPLDLKVGAVFEAGTDEVDIPPDLLPPGSPRTEAKVEFVGGGISVALEGETPTSPWKVVYGAEFSLGGKTYMPQLTTDPSGGGAVVGNFSKASFELKAYIGIGVGGHLGPFKAEASVGIGPVIVYEGDWGFGGFVFFDAKVDVKIVTVGVYGEFSLMIVKKVDGDYAAYEGEVGIYVKILFFSIKASIGFSKEDKI